MSDPYPGERNDLKCPECDGLMVLRKSPKYDSPFYGCSRFPECRGTHGAHPDGAPLGVPANKATKAARIQTHLLFDKLWKPDGPMKRREAYEWFQGVMQMTEDECHIGRFDIETCRRAERVVRDELRRRRLIEIDPGLLVSLWLLYRDYGDDLTDELREKFEHALDNNNEEALVEPATSIMAFSENFSPGGSLACKMQWNAQKVISDWLAKCTSTSFAP